MSEMKELIIDPEFASQIPPLAPDEYDRLEAGILEEGAVINAIVTWNGIIIDGHHRYEIIQKYPERNIHYSVYEKDFPDRNAAEAWMFQNQLGRRNLTPAQRKYLMAAMRKWILWEYPNESEESVDSIMDMPERKLWIRDGFKQKIPIDLVAVDVMYFCG